MDKNIILIGMKACGKSTVGKLLAEKLNTVFIELDDEIEKLHFNDKKEKLTFREIFKKYGGDYFRSLEQQTLKNIALQKHNHSVISCGGGTPLDPENQKMLKELGTVIYLDVQPDVLLPRIIKYGIPAFFPYRDDPKKSLDELLEKRKPIYTKTANQTITFSIELPEELVVKIIELSHV